MYDNTLFIADLENLNNETLLGELKIRFQRDCMYTYVGEILVAVNPFKMISGNKVRHMQ